MSKIKIVAVDNFELEDVELKIVEETTERLDW
jgi:hypothetical protein